MKRLGSEKGSAALVFLNRRTDGTPARVSVLLRDLGLVSPAGYSIAELFDGRDMGLRRPDEPLKLQVNPSGNTNSRPINN